MILIALPVVTLGLPVRTIAQDGATLSGHRYVMKIEIEKVADAGGEEANRMFATVGEMLRHTLLPDGVVEASITTDGRSVRSELRGRVLAMPSGTVVLTRAGDANDGYVLDPAAKTYYIVKPAAMNTPDPPAGVTVSSPEVSVNRSGIYDTIVGYRAEKIAASWRMAIPVPDGVEMPPGFPSDVRIEIEEWCSPDVKLPSSKSTNALTAIGSLMPGAEMDALLKMCSVPLRARLYTSMMPGYRIVYAVTSITRTSVSPDLFTVPVGYKEVPMPAPKPPGGGG